MRQRREGSRQQGGRQANDGPSAVSRRFGCGGIDEDAATTFLLSKRRASAGLRLAYNRRRLETRATMAILIKNARILTFDAAAAEHERADILIRGSTIAAIGRDLAPAAGEAVRVVDAAGWLAMPGLINAHFHSPGN